MSKRQRRRVRRKLFCINSMPRCGTHLLKTALEQHPAICCYSEIFNYFDPAAMQFAECTISETLIQLASQSAKRVGFCVHRNHETSRVESLKHKMASIRIPYNIPTIVLYRENMLEQYISICRAKAVEQWQVYNGEPVPTYPPLQLEFAAVKKFFNKNQKLRFPARVHWKTCMVLSYEQLTKQTPVAIRHILAFLKLPQMALTPRTVKTGIAPREAVINYDDLQEQFAKTSWAHFFRDHK